MPLPRTQPKFLFSRPDGSSRWSRWVREPASQSNSGGWVEEEWDEPPKPNFAPEPPKELKP